MNTTKGEPTLEAQIGTATAYEALTGHVVGIDASPGMVAVARQLTPTIEWREGVAEALPFRDQSFEVVVSQFGLMFFTDRHQALREMVRVLARGGP